MHPTGQQNTTAPGSPVLAEWLLHIPSPLSQNLLKKRVKPQLYYLVNVTSKAWLCQAQGKVSIFT